MPLAPNSLNSYPNTGLTQLGDALLRGTGDYANIRLRQQHEDDRRAQRLADLADARQFATGQFNKQRGLALEDEARRRSQKVDDETYQILIKEGWLKPIDATNPGAIAVAADNRQKYIDKERMTEGTALENAQAELNSLAADRASLALKDADLNSKIQSLQQDFETASERSEMVVPTQKMIDAEAVRLATAAGVKLATKEPKRSAQLANYAADAERRMTQAAGMAAISAQNKLRAIQSQFQTVVREKTATTNQLQVVRSAIADLTRQFKLAPVRTNDSPAKTLSAPSDGDEYSEGAVVVPAGGSPADFIQHVRTAVAGNRPTVAAPSIPSVPQVVPQRSDRAPATSILGMAQRLPPARELAMAPANILAAPGRAIDVAGRGISAGLQGIWNGDYSVPDRGLIERAGTGIGSLIAGPLIPSLGDQTIGRSAKDAEDRILREQPNSPMAAEIVRRRSERALPVLNPLPAPTRSDVFGRDFVLGRT